MKATLARLIAGLLAGVTAFLVSHFGIAQEQAVEITAGLTTALAAASYGVGHKLLRKVGLDDETKK